MKRSVVFEDMHNYTNLEATAISVLANIPNSDYSNLEFNFVFEEKIYTAIAKYSIDETNWDYSGDDYTLYHYGSYDITITSVDIPDYVNRFNLGEIETLTLKVTDRFYKYD